MRSWFLLDLASTVPVNTIIDLVQYYGASDGEAARMRSCEYLSEEASCGGDYSSIQTLRMVRLVRLLIGSLPRALDAHADALLPPLGALLMRAVEAHAAA